MVQRERMPTFEVQTAHQTYASVVERGILKHLPDYIPPACGKVFVVTTRDVWEAYRTRFPVHAEVLFFAGGEPNKRLAAVEQLADAMLESGADRTSLVVGFGGGIVTDISGFLAAIFMRGIPVIQIPTTLLAQVDAGIGGKTGVNLAGGKNLIGSFHQPLAVLIDPELLETLPEREFRAGLFEVVKCGIIRDAELFELLLHSSQAVLRREPALVDAMIAAAVRIKAEVVSADEREGDLRRILNFGHTIGHALEAETSFHHFLHGEAVAWGMIAAARLAELLALLCAKDATRIKTAILAYGPLPDPRHIDPDHLLERLNRDKKTLQGRIHFILPTGIGQVRVVSGIDPVIIREAIVTSLQ